MKHWICALLVLFLINVSSAQGLPTLEEDERFQLFNFLQKPNIQKLMGITPKQSKLLKQADEEGQKLLHEAMQNNTRTFLAADIKRRATSLAILDELLPPEKQKVLAQLRLRYEVSLFGLKTALLDGVLGGKIGIHENQRTNLEDKASRIMAEAESQIREIRKTAEARLLNELSTEQQAKATDLLGPYIELSEVEERVAKIEEIKARRQLQQNSK